MNTLPQSLVRDKAEHVPPTDTLETPTHPAKQNKKFPQHYCGELTGDVTANIFCFGYAIHDDNLQYLNIAGPKMACEAIRAKLNNGQSVFLHPHDNKPSIEMSSGDEKTSQYHVYTHHMPEARYTSMILVHKHAVEPDFSGHGQTCFFAPPASNMAGTDTTHATAKLLQLVRDLVAIPIFDHWQDWLWKIGREKSLVMPPLYHGGGVVLWMVSLERTPWELAIQAGVRKQQLTLTTS